jgi:hypothetical protein
MTVREHNKGVPWTAPVRNLPESCRFPPGQTA